MTDLREQRVAVDKLGIALNDAKYTQATCQNNAVRPANQCVNLTLELNRLIDDLAYTQDMQDTVSANEAMASGLLAQRRIGRAEYEAFVAVHDAAKADTEVAKAEVDAARAAAVDAECKKPDRPAPKGTCNAARSGMAMAVPADTPTDIQALANSCMPSDTCTPVPSDAPTDVPTDTPTDTATPTDIPTDPCISLYTDPCALTDTPAPSDTPTDTMPPTDMPTPADVLTYLGDPCGGPTDSPTPTLTPSSAPTS